MAKMKIGSIHRSSSTIFKDLTLKKKFRHEDPLLEVAVNELISKHGCHTILLYGSRARGDWTEISDYDLMGVRAKGGKLRLAKRLKGKYLDVFIFNGKDLKTAGEHHLYMKGAQVLVEKNDFGKKFLKKLAVVARKKFKPSPKDEIDTRRIWAHKMLERIAVGDIEGNYRRSWLQEALLMDYFEIRKKRFTGSKESFAWLKKNDLETYTLYDRVLSNPTDLTALKSLVERVTRLKIKKD